MASAGEKSLAVGHIPGFQIDPNAISNFAIKSFLLLRAGSDSGVRPDFPTAGSLSGNTAGHRHQRGTAEHCSSAENAAGNGHEPAAAAASRASAPSGSLLRLPVAAVRVFSYCTVRPEGDRKNLRHSGKRHSGAGGSELTVPHL